MAAIALGLAFVGCAKSDGDSHANHAAAGAAKAQKYHCPMHPTYVSDRPGDCPICNMKLVPIKDEPAAPAQDATTPAGHAGHSAATPGEAPAVPGRIAIALSPEKRQLIGLTTEMVAKRELTQLVRATATLEHDETRLARIAPRFAGWVRDLKVNATGQAVARGEPLFTVYSPELLGAENEYLLAYQRIAQLQGGPDDPQLDAAKRLAESARRRLSLWQIGDAEIAEIERTGRASDELLVRSPVSGHVVAKTAVEGKAFLAGETLYEIADLTHLWVRAAVPEFEMPLIKVGQKARVVLPYLGNKSYETTVAFIYPHIEPQSRRAEIRLELDNPENALRPSMWANVEIDASFGDALLVPASAVIDTGVRHVAFVRRDDDHLEPRDVKIGVKTDDFYQVLGGLAAGERVVVRALFLVDSESQLKAAIAGMGAAGGHNH